jgi:hypothetical protein
MHQKNTAEVGEVSCGDPSASAQIEDGENIKYVPFSERSEK